MLAALVVLVLMVVTNIGALFYCCYATDYYGLWLQTFHKKDLYCLRILVLLLVALVVEFISLISCTHWVQLKRQKSSWMVIFLTITSSYIMHINISIFFFTYQYVFPSRSRTVWLSTPPGPPSPPSSTSHWFSSCGAWPRARQPQPRSASCLERSWPGESLQASALTSGLTSHVCVSWCCQSVSLPG